MSPTGDGELGLDFDSAVQQLVEEEEHLLDAHMGAIQGDAALLTEEGELLARVQGDDIVNYDIDAYVTRLEAVRSRPAHPVLLLATRPTTRPCGASTAPPPSLARCRSRSPHMYIPRPLSPLRPSGADPNGEDRSLDAPARAVAEVPPASRVVRREQNGRGGRVVSAVTARAAGLAALLLSRAAALRAAKAGGASA